MSRDWTQEELPKEAAPVPSKELTNALYVLSNREGESWVQLRESQAALLTAEIERLQRELDESQATALRWKQTCQRMSAGHEPATAPPAWRLGATTIIAGAVEIADDGDPFECVMRFKTMAEALAAQKFLSGEASPPPSDDAQLLDFLQGWLESSKAKRFEWDTFSFSTNQTVRDQLRSLLRAYSAETKRASTVACSCGPACKLKSGLQLDADEHCSELGEESGR